MERENWALEERERDERKARLGVKEKTRLREGPGKRA
jgi:hypothetical protein